MTETMKIWNAVSKTNPDHTKHVNQRGGFTSINANSQIMEATRQFGPIGIGWGYITGNPIFHETLMFVPVTLWHGDRSNTFGPMLGCEEWKSDKGRIDSDAGKKATTDAVTKLLSQLGFNADVFLGLWDDQKYVEQRKREVAAETVEPVPDSVTMFLDGLRASYADNSTAEYWKQHWPAVPKEWRLHVMAEKEQIKAAHEKVAYLRAG